MPRLAFLQFYPNDWLAEPSIRACSVAARGLWIDMLSLMHLSPRRGYLLSATGSPLSQEQLARLTGCTSEEASRLIAELRSSGCFNCTDDGTIYSRRMVRDEAKRQACSEAGRRGGGNPKLQNHGENGQTFKGHPKGVPKGDPKGDLKPPEAIGQKPETIPPKAPHGGEEGARFSRFWNAYPKKNGRSAAWQAFGDIGPDEPLLAKMLAAISWKKSSGDWTREGGRFIPKAADWLTDGRWEEAPPQILEPQSAVEATLKQREQDAADRANAAPPEVVSSLARGIVNQYTAGIR